MHSKYNIENYPETHLALMRDKKYTRNQPEEALGLVFRIVSFSWILVTSYNRTNTRHYYTKTNAENNETNMIKESNFKRKHGYKGQNSMS